ncbi:flavin-containing monooxygenase [Actinomadura parmotrematis]|uniref:NAD(P)/FAD-dependent oxidoreductase n=1 Tax=Actinomadura parmotrematis TaxID=2864039 RepID=A0ABS7FRV4_9ACTN|nr:NAD(P)/FAD-dependent oxidoreductase [Actinomadura parmotrematis]MBW8482454.1 NAD(P)/FAD-dependent oxidoreductase [Actinomadura parmotrematis]
MTPDHEVLVVGAGFSGLCVGIHLLRAGVRDFAIVDAAPGVGGVWRHNTYPGVAVDVPSATYCYSFEPNPGWTRAFAPGAEVRAYAEHCADKYRLRPHLRLNTRVEAAAFDAAADVWRVRTPAGEITARFLVSAVGPLDQPKDPDIPGLADFAGAVVHTARWDHGLDLAGRRVAVVGTGASGLQVIPEIAGRAAHLDVYQRTPIWVFPKVDFAIPAPVRALLRAAPPVGRLVRLATAAASEAIMVLGIVHYRRAPFLVRAVEAVCRAHLRRQVPDRRLRRALSPRYAFGCKRPSFSNRYYPTFLRDDVELVTAGIERITPGGIVDRDGVERPADVLVLATGFRTLEIGAMPPFPVTGLGGVELGAFWDEHRYQNYEGLAVPQAPNFWLMNGPYSVTGASWFSILEAGATHTVRCITEARRRRATRAAVRQGPHDAFTADMRRRMKGTILAQPSCASSRSYYFDRHGDAPYVRPQSGLYVWRRSRTFDLDDYEFTPAKGQPSS